MDKLNIRDIKEFPVGTPLETPLHPKKRRTWNPSLPSVSCPPKPDPQLPTDFAADVKVMVKRPSSPQPPRDEPSLDVPSPAMFVECGGSLACSTRRSAPRPSQSNRNAKLNYGSEPESDSDESDDEVAPALVPRAFRAFMETPLDSEAVSPADADGTSVSSAEASTAEFTEVGTYESNTLFNFQWTSFPNPPIPPKSRRETFSDINVGPTTPCVDPYGTFISIWDQRFMEHIASETNRYAQEMAAQMLESSSLRPTSRICDWYETTVDELYTYFALIIAMGVIIKSRLEEYWSAKKDIFYTPGFTAHMSLRRFQLLSRCLHFNSNEDMCALELDDSEAKLYKIKPVMSHLNNKFQTLYNMRQNIALDESLLQWKGWLNINQFIPNKVATVGIKTYEICESQTGYLWRFEVHAYNKNPVSQQHSNPLDATTPATVLRLVHGLEGKGHTLWMDNFYNSPALARKLKTLGFDCVGTLRTNRQFVPKELGNLTKENMRPGQITGCTSGDVDLMVWRDQNRVATISTYHGNATTIVDGIAKPILILDYNIMMGGVDKKDQMLAMYPIERKRTRIWYKKLFRRLLNVSVLNSFIIFKQSSCSSISHRTFRLSLVRSLLEKHSSRSTSHLSSADIAPPPLKFEAKHHHVAEYPIMAGQTARQRRLCCLCRKRMHFYCVGCNKPMCISPCFSSLHK